MRFARFALVALLVLVVLQVAYYAPKLPDTVASHFDAQGQPDGWSSKTAFLVLYGVILLVTIVPLLLLPLFLPRIPDELVNLPHKDYWLAPARRAETFRTISAYLLWFGVGTLMLISHAMGMALAENLEPRPRFGESMWWSLGAYLAFVAVWMVVFIRRFYRAE